MHGVLRYYTVDAKNVNEIVRRVADAGRRSRRPGPRVLRAGLAYV